MMFLSSCEKENLNKTLMTATISGDAWRCTEPKAIITDESIYISGLSPDGLEIDLFIKSSETGGYNLQDTLSNKAMLIPNRSEFANEYTSQRIDPNGILRITEIDKENLKISGTFFFKAWHPTDPIYEYISNGKFKNVPYTYIVH